MSYNLILANLVLTHDVERAECLEDDTVKYTLENGKAYTIKFGEKENGIVTRDVWDNQGRHFYEEDEFNLFELTGTEDEIFDKEDYAQWTADNFFEIEDTFEEMEECGLMELKITKADG